ncbi:MAG: Na/Pi cotransporter family protein [Oliverpabstia sp.]|nr:Na/Pi cotransporter family protein [Oliverpabstia sp.]
MMIVMSLIGSLGLFLYGLKTMSEGMQQAAGEKMRSILEVFTKNKLVSVLVGTFFTALIQSADGTAVLTMSFVNSGLLELSQSAGLLLGANLGSGVTGQMLSFDPEYLAPVLILGGVILTIAGRKKKMAVTTGQIFLGFGFLFVGISGFSRNLMMAGNISLVENIFQWIANPVLAVGTGFLLGMLFQSELAVMGLLAVLAGGEWLSLSAGLFMLLGANVGCSLSVALIGLGCKKEGKRVAGLQMLMNLAGGMIWIVLLFFGGQELEEFFLRVSSGQRNLALVNANMIMKLVWVVCLMPFTGWLIRGTKKLIPGQDGTEDTFVLKYIGGNHAFSPATAVLQAIRETEEMAKLTAENLSRSVETIQEPAPEKIRKVNKTEQNINFLHREITSYLVQLKQSTLAIDDVVYVDSLLYMVTDLERIADRCERITNSAVKLRDSSVLLTREGEEDLRELAGKVERVLKEALEVFYGNDRQKLPDILATKEEISQSERELQAKYIERIAQDECSLEAGMIFADIISDLERVAVHGVNIACGAQEDI